MKIYRLTMKAGRKSRKQDEAHRAVLVAARSLQDAVRHAHSKLPGWEVVEARRFSGETDIVLVCDYEEEQE